MGEVIQLVVAPVFLLVAIGSLLGVIAGRLARVVDRARELEKRLRQASSQDERALVLAELRALDRRMGFNHWAINFFSISALIVTVLVSTLFLTTAAHSEDSIAIPVLFICAMTGIMAGIMFFIAEVYVATRTVRVRFDLL